MPFDPTLPAARLPDEAAVARQALRHLSTVLGLPEASLSPGRYFDILPSELAEVADDQLREEMQRGTLLINVHTYCEQMARCSRFHPDKVARVLGF